MKRTERWIALLLLAVMAVSLLAGCQSGPKIESEIVGKWKLLAVGSLSQAPQSLPEGAPETTMQFTDRGKFKQTNPDLSATYQLSDDMINVYFEINGAPYYWAFQFAVQDDLLTLMVTQGDEAGIIRYFERVK